MAAELGANLVGDYEQRRAGLESDGKLAGFEYGETTRFREECPVFLENGRLIKDLPKKRRKAERKIRKEKEAIKEGKVNEKEENIGPTFDLRGLEITILAT